MTSEAKQLAEKVINRMADQGAWLSATIKDATTWAKSKDRSVSTREVEEIANAIYAEKKLTSRGQKQ